MDRFFNASSLAVIGVSPRPGNLGRNIVANLELFGYSGNMYLVSPKGGEFKGRKIYPDVRELPEAPELAVILTPAATTPDLLTACGQKGIQRVVIESGGFSELSGERSELENKLSAIAREYGIRFIGPNCIGVVSTHSGVALPFPIIEPAPLKGGVAIVAQSGGIGLTYLYGCSQPGVGVSKFASVGNKLNVNEEDLLAYLAQDPQTEVILLYLESIVAGRAMFDIIKNCPKPVVVHKSNIAPISNAIAQSHTSALANDDQVVDAALEQAGALRGRSVSETLNLVKGLCLPKPKGKRMAIISRSGGHAVVAADAAHRQGMSLPKLPESFFQEIQKSTRASVIKLQNPLDLGDLFDFNLYVDILRGALEQDNVDCAMVLHGYRGPEAKNSRRFVQTAGELCRQLKKPVALCVLVGQDELPIAAELARMPLFPAPDEAVAALASAAKAGAKTWPEPPKLEPPINMEKAAEILAQAGPGGELELPEALQLAQAAGIAAAPFEVAANREEAILAGNLLGYPVVLKAVGVSHKTEQGAVILNLASQAELEAAYDRLAENLSPTRMVVMKQISGSLEIIAGGKKDAAFGPVLLCGLGGVTAEVLEDVSLRLAPVAPEEAAAMLNSLKGSRLLDGFRGAPACSRPAIVNALVKLSALLAAFPNIRELDLNPLLAGPGDCLAADARVFVERNQ